ncbi:MAG: hypothetical protein M3Y21_04455 [Candidatus Eremiobacteraeota bacterium]|nr:hypothetical protein [Candidatus Eremiobacteraeota bacterium]
MTSADIDYSVYPDEDAPASFDAPEDRADYIHRICSAWDFGVIPTAATFALFEGWRGAFDRFPVSGSPAYHAFRSWFGWPQVPGSILQARYERLDAREGRTDPCEGWI